MFVEVLLNFSGVYIQLPNPAQFRISLSSLLFHVLVALTGPVRVASAARFPCDSSVLGAVKLPADLAVMP